MQKGGILNSHIAKVLADLGHTDTIVSEIADYLYRKECKKLMSRSPSAFPPSQTCSASLLSTCVSKQFISANLWKRKIP